MFTAEYEILGTASGHGMWTITVRETSTLVKIRTVLYLKNWKQAPQLNMAEELWSSIMGQF